MKPSELLPGQYELREDVLNPNGDGRQKRSLCFAKTWPKGTKIVVREVSWPFFVEQEAQKKGEKLGPRYELKILPYGRFTCGTLISCGTEAYDFLVEALEPMREDIEGLLSRREFYKSNLQELLEEMVERKMVTMAAVESAMDSLYAKWGEV